MADPTGSHADLVGSHMETTRFARASQAIRKALMPDPVGSRADPAPKMAHRARVSRVFDFSALTDPVGSRLGSRCFCKKRYAKHTLLVGARSLIIILNKRPGAATRALV